MSGSGPTDGDDPGDEHGDDHPDRSGDNPFEGMPFFGDLGKLLGGFGGGGGTGLQWDTTRQVAMQLAAGGEQEPNIDPLERMEIEELARVADLHVSSKTGLSTNLTGKGVTVIPVTRTQWAQRSIDAFKPLFESLSGALGPGSLPAEQDPADQADPLSGMLTQLMGAMAPMMLSVTAGGMLGHLAQASFGQYDLPVPRQPDDELLLVLPNVDAFGADWSIEAKDLRLWLCIHEIAHHAVLGVAHVREALEAAITEYASGFRPDSNALVDKLGSVDLTNPEAMGELQQVLGDPEVVLGAMQTDEQRAMLPQLEALVALVVGYVDHVMDELGATLLGNYGMITEALRRRRVEADESDRFVAKLFGLELGQSTYDMGAAFVDGVVERAGFDALEPLWKHERYLPTPAEIEAPGLWLARIEIPEEPDRPDDA
ncbi:MAG: zinc-dependent metalloprotease [Acidimicrobiales bacterium]|nr:zinc-dependent metalloprotease [Acidimicrobiales bacterium]